MQPTQITITPHTSAQGERYLEAPAYFQFKTIQDKRILELVFLSGHEPGHTTASNYEELVRNRQICAIHKRERDELPVHTIALPIEVIKDIVKDPNFNVMLTFPIGPGKYGAQPVTPEINVVPLYHPNEGWLTEDQRKEAYSVFLNMKGMFHYFAQQNLEEQYSDQQNQSTEETRYAISGANCRARFTPSEENKALVEKIFQRSQESQQATLAAQAAKPKGFFAKLFKK